MGNTLAVAIPDDCGTTPLAWVTVTILLGHWRWRDVFRGLPN